MSRNLVPLYIRMHFVYVTLGLVKLLGQLVLGSKCFQGLQEFEDIFSQLKNRLQLRFQSEAIVFGVQNSDITPKISKLNRAKNRTYSK